MVINVACPICRRTFSLDVPQEGYFKWRRSEALIQDAMPNLSATERELLMSGICSRCWDKLFKEL